MGKLLRELAGVALKGDVRRQAQMLPNKLILELPMTLAENGLAGNESLQRWRGLRKLITNQKAKFSTHHTIIGQDRPNIHCDCLQFLLRPVLHLFFGYSNLGQEFNVPFVI